MLFYAPLFLFLFLPLSIVSVFIVPWQYRNGILLAWSLAFYLWGEPQFIGIAILSSIIDYWIGYQICKTRNTPRARMYLVTGVLLNLLLLVYYKYLDFGITSLNSIFQPLGFPTLSLLSIALPIGISFIVFEKITYLVDLYRGLGQSARSLNTYLFYVFFFPKLLAGPIVKYYEIEAQLIDHQMTPDDFLLGFR